MCGEFRFSVSQYSSLGRLLPRPISAFLIVIHSVGSGVVPKSNSRQRQASLSTISMQVNAVVAFAWIRR